MKDLQRICKFNCMYLYSLIAHTDFGNTIQKIDEEHEQKKVCSPVKSKFQ